MTILRLSSKLRHSRFASSQHLGIASLGSLRVTQDRDALPVSLELVTSWDDDSSVTGVEEVGGVIKLDKQKQVIELHLPATDRAASALAASASSTTDKVVCRALPVVRFSVPEKLNVDVQLTSGDILVEGTKLECPTAPLVLSTHSGSIRVKSVRAEAVRLEAPNGRVFVSKAAEATDLQLGPCASVFAKRLAAQHSVAIQVNSGGGAIPVGVGSGEQMANACALKGAEKEEGGGSLVHVDSLYSPKTTVACVVASPAASAAAAPSLPPRRPLVFVDSVHGELAIAVDAAATTLAANHADAQETATAVAAAEAEAAIVSVQRITGQVTVDVGGAGGGRVVAAGEEGEGESLLSGGVELHFDEPMGSSSVRTANGSVHVMVNHEASLRVALQCVGGEENKGGGGVVVKKGTSFFNDNDDGGDSSKKEGESSGGGNGERVLIGRSGRVVSSSNSNASSSSSSSGGDWCSEVGEVVEGVLLPTGARAASGGLGGGGATSEKGGRGKVDLQAAKLFGSSTSFFGSSPENRGGDAEPDDSGGGGRAGGDLAVLSVVARGARQGVTLESLSWRDSIKRKFGVK